MKARLALGFFGAVTLLAGHLQAQHGLPAAQPPATPTPTPAPAPAAPAAENPMASIFAPFERRNPDPAAVARGRTVYTANGCSFCHGADARGGASGPSLLRSQKVLQDRQGEIIGEVVRNGVPGTAMQAFALSPTEIGDVAEFLHSFSVAGYDNTRLVPATFTMGNARAGRRYFGAQCSSCHSVTGDLRGFAARFPQPRALQQAWLMPTARSRTTVTVTPASGPAVSGNLERIDEFRVTLTQPDGTRRTFTRNGDVPAVEVHDPLTAHRALLPRYRDDDIHNVTAYLASLR